MSKELSSKTCLDINNIYKHHDIYYYMKSLKKYWWIILLLIAFVAIIIYFPNIQQSSFGAVKAVSSTSTEIMLK